MQTSDLEKENHKLKKRAEILTSISLSLLSIVIYLACLIFTSQMHFHRQQNYYLMEIEQHEENYRNLKIENALLQNALGSMDKSESVEEDSATLR